MRARRWRGLEPGDPPRYFWTPALNEVFGVRPRDVGGYSLDQLDQMMDRIDTINRAAGASRPAK